MNNPYYTVCGIVEIDHKILLVRHTYGTAKDRILLPGGYVKENEMPTDAVKREIFEETGVMAVPHSIQSIQFKPGQWCVVFRMNYLSGTPKSDGHENSEVLLLSPEEAITRTDITHLSRAILTAYLHGDSGSLQKGTYVSPIAIPEEYAIFGVE